MRYYTSDIHFGYKQIISTANRPFENTDEMNETILRNINEVLNKDDVLIILGDVCSYGNHQVAIKYLKKVNCDKVLIIGNHDKEPLKHKSFRNMFVDIRDNEIIRDGKHSIFLSHYPHAEWDGYYKGIWHFYGHVHNSNQGAGKLMKLFPTSANVGMDVNNFRPHTANEIIEKRMSEYKKGICVTDDFIKTCIIPTIDNRAGYDDNLMKLAGY